MQSNLTENSIANSAPVCTTLTKSAYDSSNKCRLYIYHITMTCSLIS